eukprot:TRINITY_DN36324_c0_g1_i1.p1 TRINITY_DN36324_c0_g1~~TRINITY_DN36324_c0_g1_i1.p1  ORF type:complete len:640 (+),score=135.62 TRINITY_DN36324_c0_g1_i1:64-1983(+)
MPVSTTAFAPGCSSADGGYARAVPPSMSSAAATAPLSRRHRLFLNPKSGSVFRKIAEQLRTLPFWEDVSMKPEVKFKVSAAQRRGGMLPDVDLVLEDRYVADHIIDTHAHNGTWTGSSDQACRRRLVNSYSGTKCLTLKATMVKTLKNGTPDPWSLTPMTFVLNNRSFSQDDRDDFCRAFKRLRSSCANVWILKPSHRNKGIGIEIFSNDAEALTFVDRSVVDEATGKATQYVAQKYIERPLLIGGRKFDLRTWVVVTPDFDIWLYREGVLRTASEDYQLRDLADRLSHLTNHCIQETGPNFGKFEEGNEMWYADFQKYLDGLRPGQPGHGKSLAGDILPQAQRIIVESLLAARKSLTRSGAECKGEILESFQLFGFDFMVDADMKVWLIEVNGSPASAEALLDNMMSDLVEIVVEPMFPAPPGYSYNHSETNKFERIFPPRTVVAARTGRQATSVHSDPLPEHKAPLGHMVSPPVRDSSPRLPSEGFAADRVSSPARPLPLRSPTRRPGPSSRIPRRVGTAGSTSPELFLSRPSMLQPAAERELPARPSVSPRRLVPSGAASPCSTPLATAPPSAASPPVRAPDAVCLSPARGRSHSSERVNAIIERIDSLLSRIKDAQKQYYASESGRLNLRCDRAT